jgi:hypothetical protein
MIITAAEMYQSTLRLVNKSHTISIEPEEWQDLVRLSQVNVVKRKYQEFQLTQKRIDDLRILISDPLSDPVIAGPVALNTFPLPILSFTGQPNYFVMLNCAFKIQYQDNVCGLEGLSEWLKAKPMRDDLELQIMEDPYNKPTDSRLYYKQIGNNVLLYTGTGSFGFNARYSYLKYPPGIKLLPTPINCILPFHVRQEIAEDCARMIIELIESGRYSTYLNELRLSAS